jgi:hypothetical protein
MIASLPPISCRRFPLVAARAMVTCAIALPVAAAAQDLPILVHGETNGLYREASSSIESYTSTEASASLQIYTFRPFTGDLKQAFGSTLLREWIDPQYRETAVSGMPTFNSGTLPGAEAVYGAQFTENAGGMPHPRLRLAILAKQAVAVVDVSAASPAVWQRVWPAMQALLASLKVEAAAPSTAGPPATGGDAGTGLSGIFSGITTRLVSDLTRGPGSFLRQPAVRYYLFSATGLVYRTFEQPDFPATEVSRFNFAVAARQDPDNSGTYRVDNGQLTIHLGGSQPETVTGRVTSANAVLIDSVTYEREH